MEGDLWGKQTVEKNVTKTVTANVEFKVGDTVTLRGFFNKILDGKIARLNANTAIIGHRQQPVSSAHIINFCNFDKECYH